MILNTHPEDRKEMVKAISELLNIPAVYQFTPTYSFRIGEITVNRDGTVFSDDLETLMKVAPMLVENGWLDEQPDSGHDERENSIETTAEETEGDEERQMESDSKEDEEPKAEIKIEGCGLDVPGVKNLIRVLYSKQHLINRMLRMNRLFIDSEVVDRLQDRNYETVSDLETMLGDEERVGMMRGFDYADGTVTVQLPFDENYPTHWEAYSRLMEAVIGQARKAKRTKAEKQEEEANEKYQANAWLNRLGFGGPDSKELRRVLMGHLRGYAAFQGDEQMLRHKQRLAEQRRIRREISEEAETHD